MRSISIRLSIQDISQPISFFWCLLWIICSLKPILELLKHISNLKCKFIILFRFVWDNFVILIQYTLMHNYKLDTFQFNFYLLRNKLELLLKAFLLLQSRISFWNLLIAKTELLIQGESFLWLLLQSRTKLQEKAQYQIELLNFLFDPFSQQNSWFHFLKFPFCNKGWFCFLVKRIINQLEYPQKKKKKPYVL